ncbi:hypothetical protein H2198_002834 [Neophaeococcomyces mojaviensis]|uniref:Uncharacterized protein n=1 Tax=Neophaeococcomyces mojaviensis TaxID=3383035 RepID=A0ACC3ADH8_9EURO|nr:hypothetical protein H2198_002834 [Knufia sp. JES_112]
MHESYTSKTNGHPREQDMNTTDGATQTKRSVTTPRIQKSWFELPAPIRQLFDTFPLITYDENLLPQRTSIPRTQTTLHIFTPGDQANRTRLSPNPACLRWQAYLLINKLPFSIVSANNHASPSGALPFILPATKSRRDPQPQAISSAKIQRWAITQGAKEEVLDVRSDAYMALIDQNIRNAWLYNLYLQDENFEAVAKKLYIRSASSNSLVQMSLAYQLRAAAKDELLRTRTFIDAPEIYDLAEAAFRSLSTLLADEKFFTKTESPGLFDVALFAYTHPLLDLASSGDGQDLEWRDKSLLQILMRHEKLVEHRERVLKQCLDG